ncbi:MAG: SPOR domain-containing protein [Zoogloea sp.]|nr:SPOR domain-containing protein [Zoogloea sp.]
MGTLRVAVLILLVANLLALAVWKGGLGSGASGGEPERLSNQLNPERLRLVAELPPAVSAPVAAAVPEAVPAPAESAPAPEPVPAKPARAADTAPPACVAFSGLSADQAAELSARVAKTGAGFKLSESRGVGASSWWVHIPSQGNKEGADRKAAELRRLGIEDLFIVQDAGPNQFAISLGLFKNEQAAGRHLNLLREKGVRSAQIASRGASVLRVEVRGPSDSLATLASDLSERLQGANRLECAP